MLPFQANHILSEKGAKLTSDPLAGPMSITIKRVVAATLEVHDLIDELNDVLGAAYESHRRHGLSVEQLFEPQVYFFLAQLDGFAVGCGGVAVFEDYAEVKWMYTRPVARGREGAAAQDRARGARGRQVGLVSRNGHSPAGGDRSV